MAAGGAQQAEVAGEAVPVGGVVYGGLGHVGLGHGGGGMAAEAWASAASRRTTA